jgi:hypothetical protein
MKTLIFFISSFFVVNSSVGQVFFESGPVNPQQNAPIIVYGSENLNRNIPFDKIKGSQFWYNDWLMAYFYGSKNIFFGIFKAKMNLYKNEIHYLNEKNEEFVVADNAVKKIIFYYNNDTNQIAALYRNDIEAINFEYKTDTYVQQLTTGKINFFKKEKHIIKSADSLFATQKRYYFSNEINYFIEFNYKTEKIKKLNKEHFLSFIPDWNNYEDWIKENKVKWTDEKSVVHFIFHYNKN